MTSTYHITAVLALCAIQGACSQQTASPDVFEVGRAWPGVKVVTPEGHPVANAGVLLRILASESGAEIIRLSGTTNDTGRYVRPHPHSAPQGGWLPMYIDVTPPPESPYQDTTVRDSVYYMEGGLPDEPRMTTVMLKRNSFAVQMFSLVRYEGPGSRGARSS